MADNLVSQPPLNVPMVNADGTPSKVWAIWFRDLYRRTSYKGGNAIDDNKGVIDGTVDTLEELIIVVVDHEVRIVENKNSIEENSLAINNNSISIQENSDNIFDNEARISLNEDDIADNASNISDNTDAINSNSQSILDLEYRVFGDNRPLPYDDLIGYSANDYVVNPNSNPQSYYKAIDAIPSPSGAFNPSLWRKVSLIDNEAYIELTRQQAKDSFVAAGYGGIGVDAVKAIGTIDSTFKTIEGFDIDLIATPLDVTYDKANHGLKLDRQGLWEFTIKVALTFDEVNAGRQIQLRSYNATTATAGSIEFNYFVGRNQAGVNIPLTIAIDAPPSNVGDLIQLQIGSATDTFTNSSNIGTIYQVKHISERKEDLGA